MPLDSRARAALEALLAEDTPDTPEGAGLADDADGGPSGPQPDADGNYPVRLVLAVEGHETSDRRLIAAGALSCRAFPQSLAAQLNPGHGGEPGPSVICGRLDSADRVPGPEVRSRETGEPFPEGTFVWRGTGVLFGEKGKAPQHGSALDLVLKGGLTGNSVDLSNVEVELTFDAPADDLAGMPMDGPPGEDNGDGTRTLRPERPPLQTFTKAVLGMTTLVPVPAFAEAYVEIGTADGWEVITPATALADVEPSPFITADLPSEEAGAIVAAGVPQGDPLPPAWWFDEPRDRLAHLDHTVPLQVDDPEPALGGLRRVWGYVASWDSCHTGFADRCVPPPRSPSAYASYHVGTTVAAGEDGSAVRIATGPLTIGGGHASTKLRKAAAVQHYDDVCTCAGRLRCGEDDRGIWAAGYLWPEATDADVRILRASPPSGDWRDEYRQPQDMIGVHSVNTPGFRHKAAYRVDEAGCHALVAAGAIPAEDAPPIASGAVILDYDQLAERIAERMRAGGVPVDYVRPDYGTTDSGEDAAKDPQCRQNGCGKPATKVILTKGEGSPQPACDEHADGMKAKAGPGATVKGLAEADADALDLRRRRAAAVAGQTVPPREDVEPLSPEVDALALGLALDARRDYAMDAGVPYLDADDVAALSVEALKKGNWVTKVGGLPKFIKRVAKHLQEKGMDQSHAIATAVNVVKKYCAKEDLNFPGKQNVTAKTKAEGCSAVAEWEEKKARSHAD